MRQQGLNFLILHEITSTCAHFKVTLTIRFHLSCNIQFEALLTQSLWPSCPLVKLKYPVSTLQVSIRLDSALLALLFVFKSAIFPVHDRGRVLFRITSDIIMFFGFIIYILNWQRGTVPFLFLWSAPVAFRRVALETSEWTSRDSNHHRQSVSAGKTNAIPTEPSGRLGHGSIPGYLYFSLDIHRRLFELHRGKSKFFSTSFWIKTPLKDRSNWFWAGC